MHLRAKVLSGFLVLAVMLSAAGIWSIAELRSASFAVQDLLTENFRSIDSGSLMIEALERADSGTLLLLLGREEDGRVILAAADSLFRGGFDLAATNVTLPGESACIDSIGARYDTYRQTWESRVAGPDREGDFQWYHATTHRAFLLAKTSVNELIRMNSAAMYAVASELKQGAERAVMPGIVAIVAALVFSFLFSYFVDLYVVGPIVRVTDGISRFLKRGDAFDLTVDTRDEIAQLVDSIRTLISRAGRPGRDGRTP
jgi:methyl-accepting chemotaxis protein